MGPFGQKYIKMTTPAGKLFREENLVIFSESDDSDDENFENEKSENEESENSQDCSEPPKKRGYCHICPHRKGYSHLKCSKCKQTVCKKHLADFFQKCAN